MTTNNSWNKTTPLTVANNGTGNSTLTANAVLLGNGSSATNDTGAGTAGQILLAAGASADPAWITPTAGTGITVTNSASAFTYGLTVPVSVANSGTGNTSFTAYAPLCAGTTTTGAFQQPDGGAGLTNQVLMSMGSGNPPAWSTSSLIKISTQTASSSATIAFTSGISTTYTNYLLTYSGVQPVTTSEAFRMRLGTPGYVTTGYVSGEINNAYNSTTLSAGNSTTTIILSGGNNTSSTGYLSGYAYLMNLAVGSGLELYTVVLSNAFCSGTNYQNFGAATLACDSYTALELYFASGNINVGSFTLYGIVS